MAELKALVLVLRFAGEVDVPITRVAQRHCLRVDIINQSIFLAQTEIQTARHTATTKDIIEQVHGQLFGMTDRVGVRAKHDVGLVGVAAV